MDQASKKALSSTEGPWIHVADVSPSAAVNWGWAIANECPDVVVRFLRGKKMRTEQQLFDEVGAALQFPDYFGENWDAMDECITDLTWLPAKGYVFIVTDADELLSETEEARWDGLVRLLNDAASEWSEPSGEGEAWARDAVPFHVVLQANGDDFGRLDRRMRETEIGRVQIPDPGAR